MKTIRFIVVPALLALAFVSPAQAIDPAPPESKCLNYGDNLLLEGVVAERRILLKSDRKQNVVYLFRTEPMCVLEKEGKRKVDKFRLVATGDKSQYSAMSQVSGNRIRIAGKLVQVVDTIIAPNSIDVVDVTDLEAEGGPAKVLPEIPVGITFRNALLSSGKVAKFENLTDESLAVTVEFYRPGTDAKKSQDLVIDPRDTREIGEREGWAFVADDRITVTRKGMKTFTVTAP